MRVTVVGAGVAGLAVACALARRGASVRVLEAADAVRAYGAGLQVAPNGAVVLKALGLWDRVAAQGVAARAVSLCRGRTGREVLRLDLGRLRPGQDWLFIHRAALVEALRAGAEAAGAEVVTGVRVAGPDDPALAGADLVLGADGLHSVIHRALNGGVAPFYTFQTAWRAVIACDDPRPVAEVHMGPGRHLVSYPLGGGRRNLVAVEERRDWAAEGWAAEGDPTDLRARFAGFGPRVTGWLDRVERVGIWGLFRHPVARVWQRDGRTAILGDAAHPTLPFLAQGANLALEDAWTLAAAAMAPGGGADRATALAAWAETRRPRAARTVEAANRNARNYHLRRPWSDAADLGLRGIGALAPGLMLWRLDWLYGADVTAGG